MFYVWFGVPDAIKEVHQLTPLEKSMFATPHFPRTVKLQVVLDFSNFSKQKQN